MIARSGNGRDSSLSCLVLLSLALLLFAIAVYWLPQLGTGLQSDVSWLFRLQVADPASLPSVPEGLRRYGATPMGPIEACWVWYQAFGRTNCADALLWRLTASVAGPSAPGWLAISLAFNVVALILLEFTMQRLGLHWVLRLFVLACVALAPWEIWGSYVSSEPRATAFFAAAMLAAVYRRPLLAALAMAVAVAVKEPMIAWWPLVAALSMTANEDSEGIDWRSLVPHGILSVALLCTLLLVRKFLPPLNDYPFMLQGAYPEPLAFVQTAWRGLEPALLRPAGIWVFFAVTLTLVAGVVVAGRLSELRRLMREPRWWLPLLACIGGLAAHLLIHWLTHRTVGDNRYVVPGNVAVALAFALFLRPFVNSAPVWARVLAFIVGGGLLLLRFPWADGYIVIFAGLATLCVVLLGVVFALISQRRLASLAGPIAIFALVTWLATPIVDEILGTGGRFRADAAIWQSFVDEVATKAPPNAYLLLATSDPLMIETAWGLQAELLFRNRDDVTLWLRPKDLSFYAVESGLVREANEAFNYGRMNPTEASTSRPTFTLDMDRKGRASAQRVSMTPIEWARLALSDPVAFYRERYFSWLGGYLNWRWQAGLLAPQ